MKQKIIRRFSVVLLLSALIQMTGCFGYEMGVSLLNQTIDSIKKFAGIEDGIADNQNQASQGIVIGSTDDGMIVIEIDSDDKQEKPDDVTIDAESAEPGATPLSPAAKNRSEFLSVTQDPDEK